jgi:hypothetical protein
MKSWLDGVRRALDQRDRPLAFFIRDDDGGWADDRLFAVLDVCEARGCAIDVAVIPDALTPRLAAALRTRRRLSSTPVGVHQHGTSHVNHEPQGRPCEFGPSRPPAAQRRDIDNGRRRLLSLLGDVLDPIFTPPWNRCTEITGRILVEIGITVLSRDLTAGVLEVPGLAECPISVDWFARAHGRRLTRMEWAERAARHLREAPDVVGLMLHHAVTDEEELRALDELLGVVGRHPIVGVASMRAWAQQHGATVVAGRAS